MDNRENTTPVPTEGGKGYTIDELLAIMEPQYQAYQNTIRACIAGLTAHSAQLAAHGREEQLPMFRRMIVEMAGFWGLAEQDTAETLQEMTELYQGTFDHAVSAARESGCAPELSGQTREDILTGLNLYAQEMESNGDMEQWIDECDTLVVQLRSEWEMEAPRENMTQNDVMRDAEMAVPKGWLNFLREQFPEGSRIRLRKHSGDALTSGSLGVLNRITDNARFCVTWENGQHTELALETDRFSVLPAEFQTLKLYMPLAAEAYERNENGDLEKNPTDLDGRHLTGYKDIITAAMREKSVPEEKERGIMHWYDEDTSIDVKVHSVFFGVEERDSRLWGVAECRVAGGLTQVELTDLKQYLTSHAAERWGESYTECDLQLDDGEMYVYLWNSKNWSIQTEQELFCPEQIQTEQQFNEPQQGGMSFV